MKNLFLLAMMVISLSLRAQTTSPEITSWRLNSTGYTGYNNIKADVSKVQYSTNYVYISAPGIPAYNIGPWKGNPATPADQKWVFQVPRNPKIDTSGHTRATGYGPTGVYVNGVPLFNALDAMTYNNEGIWHQNAVVVEASSFDSCLGHPAPGRGANGNANGAYHHHQNPRCLYTADSNSHSPIIGYSFDGFPVYGSYAYKNTDGTGGIARMHSGYRLRNITDRTTLADGTKLASSRYGPALSVKALGYYAEDYEYDSSAGNLDIHNGRFAKTPEYPNGIYTYFVTIHADGSSAYPYAIGPTYAGVADTNNFGPGGGHIIISESVNTYSGIQETEESKGFQIYPNPASTELNLHFNNTLSTALLISLTDIIGREVKFQKNEPGKSNVILSLSGLANGMYFIKFTMEGQPVTEKIIINK